MVAGGAEYAVALQPPPKGLGKAEYKLFVPDSIKAGDLIRGVLVASQHEAGGALYEEAQWRGLAQKLQCVCLRYETRDDRGGTSGNPVIAEAVQAALKLLAKETGHAELEFSCILPTGLSAGGWQAAALVSAMPERVIGAIGIHGLGGMSSEKAQRVPVLATIAARDRLVSDRPMPIILGGQKAEAPWAAIIEPNLPHHENGDQTLNTMWAAAVIRLRVPDQIVKDQPVKLKDVDLAGGFLGKLVYTKEGDTGDMTVKEAQVWPLKEFAGDKATAHWLPDKATADEWAAVQLGKRVRTIDTTTRPAAAMPGESAVPAAGKGTPEAPVQIARLTGTIKIDGEVSDWAKIPAMPAPFSGKQSGSLRLAWSPEGIHGLVVVKTDAMLPNPRSPWEGDGIELFIDRDLSRPDKPTNTTLQIALVPQEDGKCAVWSLGNVAGEQVAASTAIVRGGYVIEFLIPAALLKPGKMEAGAKIGFNYTINDRNGRPAEQFFVDKLKDDNYRKPNTWGAVELAK